MASAGRRRRLLLTLTILGALLLCCAVGGYRYLDSLHWWATPVDAVALDARVRAELPPGSTAEQILAWLRANGVADEHIRLFVHARDGVPTTGVYHIEGWYPQRHLPVLQPDRIIVYCLFGNDTRAQECNASYGSGTVEQVPGGVLAVVTPPPR